MAYTKVHNVVGFPYHRKLTTTRRLIIRLGRLMITLTHTTKPAHVNVKEQD